MTTALTIIPTRSEPPRPKARPGFLPVEPEAVAPLDINDMVGLLRAVARACPDRSNRIVQVISNDHGEGVSTLACALAYTAAVIDGAAALVCDATENQDALNRNGADNGVPGLCDVIGNPAAVFSALTPVPARHYDVCKLSRPGANAHPAVRADRLGAVFDALRPRFDWIILDSPPVSAGSFGPALAQLCDGSVMVAQTGITTRTDLSRAERAIDLHGGRVLGVVLNEVPRNHAAAMRPGARRR